MDPEGGSESVENMRQAGNGQGRMYIVPHAGHHCMSPRRFALFVALTCLTTLVYLDNPKATNDLLIKELDRQHP